jgi:CBS-domain-containing membrane protein
MKMNLIWKKCLPGLGGFLAVFLCACVGSTIEISMLMAPFGATCVLVFVLPESPLAQPRNVIGGHLISAAIGLLMSHFIGVHAWSLGLAVGLAILCMQLTRTIHPPAGADPILVMLAGANWSFMFTPVLAGSLLIVITGFLYHFILRNAYPKKWW